VMFVKRELRRYISLMKSMTILKKPSICEDHYDCRECSAYNNWYYTELQAERDELLNALKLVTAELWESHAHLDCVKQAKRTIAACDCTKSKEEVSRAMS
jgi:hypothetical protein